MRLMLFQIFTNDVVICILFVVRVVKLVDSALHAEAPTRTALEDFTSQQVGTGSASLLLGRCWRII